ncbi:GNAT family N-acetyltransferase [Bifidobacterium sp. ESL0763]|uniref:GNAT family N-acetyltransferase n=1 Tax=Bifidobacterium sp. ESL0763 TaxID=2983227 RepID=UPI0023F66085|nr:GNAT family N-acetyltransferase [Bifidobacterium sp. ESL0763]MDF7664126.1 GNAT family N-acetyltransferase [Bifidobacterium sp. ESL0763]
MSVASEGGIVVRHITPDDFEAKAEVHARTWRETYQGRLPQWLVDKITPQFALEVTRRHDPANVFVALDGGRLIGYAEICGAARPPSDYPGTSELAAIYVLAEAKGRGAGRRLMEAALAAMPHDRVVLWVQESNAAAQGFYRHMGFGPTGRTQSEDGGGFTELEFANFASAAGSPEH